MSGEYLNQIPLFQGLDSSQCSLLQPLFQPSAYLAGDTIFEQGEHAKYLYLLTKGEVSISFKPEDGPSLTIARVRPEGVVGWSAALGNPTYTSSAICCSDCQFLQIRGEDLRWLCERYPDTGSLILERLAAMIAERLRNTHDHVIALLKEGLRIRASGNNLFSPVRGD